MSLGYDLARGLSVLRAEAESRMTETVTGGLYEDGHDQGDATSALVTERYSGKARIRYASRAVLNAGQTAPLAVLEPVLSIPVGSPELFDGDEVVVTASTDDVALVGRRYKVQGRGNAGQTTAHRYLLQELT